MIDSDPRRRGPQEVKSGSTLILTANFSGTPRPRVTWYRNGVPLGPRPGHVIVDSGDAYSTLTVLGVEVEEAGKYEVKVENLAGSAKHDFDVIVKCTHLIYSSVCLSVLIAYFVFLYTLFP